MTRRSVCVFLLMTCIFLSSVSYAFSDITEQRSAKTIAGHAKKFSWERWPVIFTGAVVGGKLCGGWCIVIGGALAGVVDGIANHFGYSTKNYLTRGAWGVVIGNKISLWKIKSMDSALVDDVDVLMDLLKCNTVPVLGFIVGVLFPTGILEKIPTYMIVPTFSIIVGDSLVAKTVGVFDELMIAKNYTNNHYLTFGVFGKNAANLWGDKLLISCTGGILGIVFAYFFEEEFIDRFKSAVMVHKKAYEAYGEALPREYLDLQAENHDIFCMGDKLLEQIILMNLLKRFQGVKHNFEHQRWDDLYKELRMMALFLVLRVGNNIILGVINNYFNEDLQFALNNQINPKVLSPGVVNYPNITVLTDNMDSDIAYLVPAISNLRSKTISSLLNGAYGVNTIIESGSPVILVYAFLYSQVDAYFTEKITSKKEGYTKEIKRLESECNSMIKHDSKNVRTIMERGGLKNAEDRIRQMGVELQNNKRWHKVCIVAEDSYQILFNWLDYIASFGLAANAIRKDGSLFAKRAEIQESSWQILNFFSWFKSTAETMSKIVVPLNNTITLIGLIYNPINNNDYIDRNTWQGNELILKNLEIGYGEQILINIDELSLEMGKVYAITGETGCGKSSLLTKIKGVKEENGAFGKGNIYYPEVDGKDPKVIMISQRDYFPFKSSLAEVIYYPNDVPDNLQELEFILKELNIRGFSSDYFECIDDGKEKLTLDDVKDWDVELSGGEKKKVILISALIKKPDILILDEIFSAFDPETIPVIQKMMKKYLPNSLILIVDHQAKNNNYYGFYSGGELHVSEQKIIHREWFSDMEG